MQTVFHFGFDNTLPQPAGSPEYEPPIDLIPTAAEVNAAVVKVLAKVFRRLPCFWHVMLEACVRHPASVRPARQERLNHFGFFPSDHTARTVAEIRIVWMRPLLARPDHVVGAPRNHMWRESNRLDSEITGGVHAGDLWIDPPEPARRVAIEPWLNRASEDRRIGPSPEGVNIRRQPPLANSDIVVRPDDVVACGFRDCLIASVRQTRPLFKDAANRQARFEHADHLVSPIRTVVVDDEQLPISFRRNGDLCEPVERVLQRLRAVPGTNGHRQAQTVSSSGRCRVVEFAFLDDHQRTASGLLSMPPHRFGRSPV